MQNVPYDFKELRKKVMGPPPHDFNPKLCDSALKRLVYPTVRPKRATSAVWEYFSKYCNKLDETVAVCTFCHQKAAQVAWKDTENFGTITLEYKVGDKCNSQHLENHFRSQHASKGGDTQVLSGVKRPIQVLLKQGKRINSDINYLHMIVQNHLSISMLQSCYSTFFQN